MPIHRPLTTRRGFLAALSFGAIGLYGVWEGLGPSPEPAADAPSHGGHGEEPEAPAGGHDGHGGAADGGPSIETFERATRDFIARHARADGSVEPLAPRGDGVIPDDDHGEIEDDHGMNHGAGHDAMADGAPPANPSVPIDVYMIAYRWAYEPDVLRLKAGQAYRFRMMALDASHGASIQLGSGSHVIRLRHGVAVERLVRFDRPGRYLVYCTIYCGAAHDQMSGVLIVS